MKGIPISQDTKNQIVQLAQMGYGYKYIADTLGVSVKTVTKYGAGHFKECKEKLYSIPDYLWAEWDMVTKSLRRYFKRSNS